MTRIIKTEENELKLIVLGILLNDNGFINLEENNFQQLLGDS